MANKIKILFQDYNAIEAAGVIPLQEDWNLIRKEKISYLTHKDGIDAADEAFHIFNAPPELLSVEQKMILDAYRGPSLSVGDVVEVYPEKGNAKAFLCASIGWQEALIEEKRQSPPIPRGIPMDPITPAPPPRRTTQTPSIKSYKPITEPTVKYHNTTCSVDVQIYHDGKSICLKLVDKNDGTPIASATVYTPEINPALPLNHVLIKNYSENKSKSPDQYSLIDSLERANIGHTISAYEISDAGAEVLEMKITDPWILARAEDKRKDISKAQKIKTSQKEKQKSSNLDVDIT